MNRPLLIAHRCGTDRFPEITLDSSRFSMEIGADYIEMDIRFTKDNVPVIAHDADTGRLYAENRLVCEMTGDEFTALRNKAHPHHKAFNLEMALQSGIFPILFHIKESRLPEIMAVIDRYSYRDKAVMGIQTPEDCELLRRSFPGTRILAFMAKPDDLETYINVGADIIRLWEEWTTAERIRRIHERNCRVWIMSGISGLTTGYTSGENLREWRRLGADGILVNEISVSKEILSQSDS